MTFWGHWRFLGPLSGPKSYSGIIPVSGSKSLQVFYHLNVLEIQLPRAEGWNIINLFNSVTLFAFPNIHVGPRFVMSYVMIMSVSNADFIQPHDLIFRVLYSTAKYH
jgi:hypothetical protein